MQKWVTRVARCAILKKTEVIPVKLLVNGLVKYLCGLALVGALLFLPAGTVAYPGGWRFIALLFIPILLVGVVMLIKAPDLLRSRLDGKEKETTQKGVVAVSGLLFLGGFITAGLDFRFGWSEMAQWVWITGSALFLIAYGLYAEVMRENAYLSRTIGVQEGQRVVDTGLYGIVRHPMYAVTILLFWMIPPVLGSWWAMLWFLPYPLLMVVRIRNEEQVLERELEGYAAYQQKVKYRLLPFVW